MKHIAYKRISLFFIINILLILTSSGQTTIWSDDFSDPTKWSNFDYLGAGHSWDVSTVGPQGTYSTSMGVINSNTTANGFALFDSDIQCDETNGQDVVIYYNALIDLSNYSNISITFQQYYKRFVDETYLMFSIDGGSNWSQLELNFSLAQNESSANPKMEDINLSSYLDGQSQVTIGFRFHSTTDLGTGAGCGYAWMVDDVAIKGVEIASSIDCGTINASLGFGTFLEGLSPVYNSFNLEDESAQIEGVIFYAQSSDYSVTYDSFTDTDDSDGWAWNNVDVGQFPPQTVIYAYCYYQTEENWTDVNNLSIIAEPSWLSESTVTGVNQTGNDISFLVDFPLNYDFQDNIPSDIIGIGDKSFDLNNSKLIFNGNYNISTASAFASSEKMEFNMNLIDQHSQDYNIDINNSINFDNAINMTVNVEQELSTPIIRIRTPKIPIPLPTPGLSVYADAGINFQASINGKISYGQNSGNWGFINDGGNVTSLSANAIGEGWIHGEASLLGGLGSVDANLSVSARISGGYTYQSVPSIVSNPTFGGDISVSGQIEARAFKFFGVGGYLIGSWDTEFYNSSFGSGFPPSKSLYSNGVNSRTINVIDNFSVPEYSPEPKFDSKDNNFGTVWVDNTGGISTLFYSRLNVGDNNFSEPIIVDENYNGVNEPDIAFLEDGSAFIVYVKNNYDLNTVPADATVEEMYYNQNAYLAYYNESTGSIEATLSISDLGGKAEGIPTVTMGGSDNGIVTWVAQPQGSNENDIWYSFLSKEDDVWYISSEPFQLTNLGGKNYSLNVIYGSDGIGARAIWINDIDGDLETPDSRVLYCDWDGSSWSSIYINFDTEEGLSYDELSYEYVSDSYGGSSIAIAVTCTKINQSTGSFYTYLRGSVYNSTNDVYVPYSTVLDSLYFYKKPRISISTGGIVALAFQKIEVFSDNTSPDLGSANLYLKDLMDVGSEWVYVGETAYLSDNNVFIWDMDAKFGSNDILYLITQETDTVNGTYTPSNGIEFGYEDLNMVIRGLQVNSDLSVTSVTLPNTVATTIKKHSYDEGYVPNVKIYPNPCSELCIIEYKINNRGKTIIDIYDSFGKKVSTLISKELPFGSYKTSFHTEGLKAGIYFARIIRGNNIQNVKIVINN